PPLQRTASCFISPVGGVRAGFSGPTKPTGTEVAWQSTHVEGCASPPAASDACNLPGKNAPVAAPAWQTSHATDGGTVVLLWNIGIGSVSLTTVTALTEVPLYVGTSAATTRSCDGSRTPSGVPTPALQSPPGRVPDAWKYLAYVFVAWWQEKQSAVPFTAWSKFPGSSLAAVACPRTRSGRCVLWQAMQLVAAEWSKLPPSQFWAPPHAPVPAPAWQVAQSWPAPCVL